MKSAITESVINSIAETESKGKVEKKAGKRVGYNYIIIKSYKESQKNDVVKCLYIKSLTDFGFCVIKEGSYGDTKDKHGRDIIDRLKWQQHLHQKLEGKLCIPKLLGHFEERGNYYLVIQHIKGKALQKVLSENRKELRHSMITGGKLGLQVLDYLIQITEILDTLHQQHMVHRDATPNNYMIMPNGKVALIDMEMCYSIGQQFPTPAFQLGTYGYMSKQQEATMTPTTAEDIFALGAIILQIWTGGSPGKITNEPFPSLKNKVEFFIPDKTIAQLVVECLLPEDHLRPTAKEIGQKLKAFKADLTAKVARQTNQLVLFSRDEIIETIQQAIYTLASPLLADQEMGWFSNDLKPAQNDDKHKLRKQWYASYNRGASGIIYLLAQAKITGMDINATIPFIDTGLELIKRKYLTKVDRKSPGLHFGSDGIAATMAIAMKNGLIDVEDDYLEWIGYLLSNPANGFNFTHGVTGQGIANIVSKSYINNDELLSRLQNYAQLLISKQDKDGCWPNGYYRQKFTRRKIKKVTRGFCEGMAGIIYFLLEFGYGFNHQESISAAEAGLAWLMRQARHKGGTVQWLSSREKELNYGWSSGIAGISLTFIKAYSHTRKDIYKEYARKALLGIPADITDSNIGQYSGLSGLGEVYLEANKVFGENIWLERAGWIVQVVMHLTKEHSKHGTYWLVESERQPVANFMVGNSGVLHFLLRHCYREEIGFPLLP